MSEPKIFGNSPLNAVEVIYIDSIRSTKVGSQATSSDKSRRTIILRPVYDAIMNSAMSENWNGVLKHYPHLSKAQCEAFYKKAIGDDKIATMGDLLLQINKITASYQHRHFKVKINVDSNNVPSVTVDRLEERANRTDVMIKHAVQSQELVWLLKTYYSFVISEFVYDGAQYLLLAQSYIQSTLINGVRNMDVNRPRFSVFSDVVLPLICLDVQMDCDRIDELAVITFLVDGVCDAASSFLALFKFSTSIELKKQLLSDAAALIGNGTIGKISKNLSGSVTKMPFFFAKIKTDSSAKVTSTFIVTKTAATYAPMFEYLQRGSDVAETGVEVSVNTLFGKVKSPNITPVAPVVAATHYSEEKTQSDDDMHASVVVGDM